MRAILKPPPDADGRLLFSWSDSVDFLDAIERELAADIVQKHS
jgi:hypothetical protein